LRKKTGQSRSEVSFPFHLRVLNSAGSFSEHFTTFVYSLLQLSALHKFEVVPGLRQAGYRCTFLQRGSYQVVHRGVPHGPKSLLCPAAVAHWKQQIFVRCIDPNIVISQPLNLREPHTTPLLLPSTSMPQFPIEYTYRAWYKRTELLRQQIRRLAADKHEVTRSTSTFEDATFKRVTA
jgi:hypothetical protein